LFSPSLEIAEGVFSLVHHSPDCFASMEKHAAAKYVQDKIFSLLSSKGGGNV